MASDLETTLSALRAADAAGDVEGARRLAEIASRFQSTGGGAALGNPNILAQGARSLRPDVQSEFSPISIGGAGAIGGALGAVAPELLGGAAAVTRALPLPGAPAIASGLDFASRASRLAGRPVSAISGAIGGTTGEAAGQAAEMSGAPPWVSEGARIVGAGIGPEPANVAKYVLQKYALVPALGLKSKFFHEAAKKLLDTLNANPRSLSVQEDQLLSNIVSEIRGGPKTDVPLENVGNIMANEGRRRTLAAEASVPQDGGVGNPAGYPGNQRTMADIGTDLQSSIVARNKAALEARSAQYRTNETARDSAVANREAAGQYPKDMPEYSVIIKSLKDELTPGKRSRDVAKSFQNILSEIKTKTEPVTGLTERQLLGYDPTPAPIETPATFQAIDDVRRQLGEVFRGKPPEGYTGIDAATARKYYGMLSDLQKSYAGEAQAKLLEDYANSTPGLEVFSSKLGKKVTALDQYREGQYPDPSSIPPTFFKTRVSIQALKELTGNEKQVQRAALDFATKELAGKDSSAARSWMTKNAEWLDEVPATRELVNQYATRLADSERAMRNSQEFVKKATADNNMLVGKGVPTQQAIDLIKSGDASKWAVIAPVIAKSPQAKTQMVSAVRQVVANEASSASISDMFNRNIRHFLEQSDIATKSEMDAVSKGLENIHTMKIPEPMRLGLARRIVLNSIGGYSASATSRAAVGGFGLLSDLVPQ